VPSLLRALAHFRHAHHEILISKSGIATNSKFPFKQWTQFESLERPV